VASNKKKYIVEFEADVKDFDQGVGHVKESIEDVSDATAEANSGFEVMGDTVSSMSQGMTQGFAAGAKGIRGMIAGMKGLKGAIAATGVGLLIVAPGS